MWSKDFGGPTAGVDTATSAGVAVDSAGSSVVVGYLRGSADFGGGLLASAGVGDVYLAMARAEPASKAGAARKQCTEALAWFDKSLGTIGELRKTREITSTSSFEATREDARRSSSECREILARAVGR